MSMNPGMSYGLGMAGVDVGKFVAQHRLTARGIEVNIGGDDDLVALRQTFHARSLHCIGAVDLHVHEVHAERL